MVSLDETVVKEIILKIAVVNFTKNHLIFTPIDRTHQSALYVIIFKKN